MKHTSINKGIFEARKKSHGAVVMHQAFGLFDRSLFTHLYQTYQHVSLLQLTLIASIAIKNTAIHIYQYNLNQVTSFILTKTFRINYRIRVKWVHKLTHILTNMYIMHGYPPKHTFNFSLLINLIIEYFQNISAFIMHANEPREMKEELYC